MEAPIAANLECLRKVNREFDMSSGASAMQHWGGKEVTRKRGFAPL